MEHPDSGAAVILPFPRLPRPFRLIAATALAHRKKSALPLFICRTMLTLIKGVPIPGD